MDLNIQNKIKKKAKKLGTYRYVVFIWLACVVYYSFIASDRFVPEAQVYVKSGKSMTMEGIPNLSLMAMGVSQASPDILLLKNYMYSKDMLDFIDKDIELREHYQSSKVDIISRLKPWASNEDFLNYYRDHLTLNVDAESGLLYIQAQAYDRDYSIKLTNLLVSEGEKYINTVGQKIAEQEIAFVQKEVDRAAANLTQAENALLAFQNTNKTLSPLEDGMTYMKAISIMRGELIKAKAELKTVSSFLNDGTSEIETLKAKISALEEQITLEEARATKQGSGSLGAQNAVFQALKLKLEFATEIYTTTITALEQTRVEAYRKLKHVVIVQTPSRPDEALYPRVIYNLVSILAILSLIYGIFVMIVATVREHRNA